MNSIQISCVSNDLHSVGPNACKSVKFHPSVAYHTSLPEMPALEEDNSR